MPLYYSGSLKEASDITDKCSSLSLSSKSIYSWKLNGEDVIDEYQSPFEIRTYILRENGSVRNKGNSRIIDTLFIANDWHYLRNDQECWGFDCEIEWKNGQCQQYIEIGRTGRISQISGCDNYLKYNGYLFKYDSLGKVAEKECYVSGYKIDYAKCEKAMKRDKMPIIVPPNNVVTTARYDKKKRDYYGFISK